MKKHKTLTAFLVTMSVFVAFFILFGFFLFLKSRETKPSPNTLASVSTTGTAVTLPPRPTLPLSDIPDVTVSSNPTIATSHQNIPEHYQIEGVPLIMQNPELPTGCEVTSLTMLLNFLGFSVDKLTLADQYLPKSEATSSSMYTTFLGDPRSTSGYGCYSPAIVRCAANYLKAQDTDVKIYDYTNSDFESLYEQIAAGHPCIIWGTISNLEPFATQTWVVDGEICQWYAQEHCMVLTGYDLTKNQVTVADPVNGIQNYDLELFKTRYNQMFRQAIFIY